MQRNRLVNDYLVRSTKRIKALIIAFGLEVPKIHDVSKYIEINKEVFPSVVIDNFERIKEISRKLRKERELSFYGMEDWIPSEEYTLDEAEQAISWAKEIKSIVEKALGKEGNQL